MEMKENEFDIQEVEPLKIEGTDEELPPIPEQTAPPEPTQDQERPKKKRGRPKKNDTISNEPEKPDFSGVPIIFTNGMIFLLSRFNLIENQPLSREEEAVLKNSFVEAFPNIETSPKTLFFLTLALILLARLKFPAK